MSLKMELIMRRMRVIIVICAVFLLIQNRNDLYAYGDLTTTAPAFRDLKIGIEYFRKIITDYYPQCQGAHCKSIDEITQLWNIETMAASVIINYDGPGSCLPQGIADYLCPAHLELQEIKPYGTLLESDDLINVSSISKAELLLAYLNSFYGGKVDSRPCKIA
jgi:hypothetical protein